MKFNPGALFLLSFPALAHAIEPENTALMFNHWYLQQVSNRSPHVLSDQKLNEYVAAATLEKLRQTEAEEVKTGEQRYDADFFTKAQYVGDDWSENLSVIMSDYDPVCLNVYIAFGKARKHVVVDCMVQEAGRWKIASVAGYDVK